MANEPFYRQCRLVLENENGSLIMTSWIPEKYAEKDKILEMKNRENDIWVNGWKVISVGSQRLSESSVIKRSRDFQNMKKVTDI